MTDVNQVRINELARELEVKAKAIIDLLPGDGVTEKKTHSSSIPEDVAGALLAGAVFSGTAGFAAGGAATIGVAGAFGAAGASVTTGFSTGTAGMSAAAGLTALG